MFTPEIIYENEDYAVLNKPNGLVVTPGAGHDEIDTLVGWLVSHYGEGIRDACVEGHRPGIVHRLDKDTSGVMVVVKTLDAFHHMVSQFKNRTVKKQYEALVWGNVSETLEEKSHAGIETFEINAPIGRNPRDHTRFAVTRTGKEALTSFTVGKVVTIKDTQFTQMSCMPQSGRTHQIRVHLKSFGHGIVGDPLYQSRSFTHKLVELVKDNDLQDRLYLHAHSLTFIPPGETKEKTFTSPVPWTL
ncbi:RluA family pseudouridine synthase [bacterium]|nr:RluA family pseudouridine synthase [bacterium]